MANFFLDSVLFHGLEALSQLIVKNHSVLGDLANNYHLTVRRYTCMALTNLTFGIGENKALLCSIEPVLLTLVEFLSSCSEEVNQVSASVIRNLSWKAYEYDVAETITLPEDIAAHTSYINHIFSHLCDAMIPNGFEGLRAFPRRAVSAPPLFLPLFD